MDREINIDFILALDAEIIRLKRTRNSLLNIASTPPEILGRIFQFTITTDPTTKSPALLRNSGPRGAIIWRIGNDDTFDLESTR
jgi:hypothetical protein